MARGGKKVTKMGEKQRAHFLRNTHRSLPPYENPHGVPKAIMKQISEEGLSGGDKQSFDLRLQQLLTMHGLNKGGSNG
jgi:hypothetical protein